MSRVVHPIEVESYRILRERVDLSHLPPLSRAVTADPPTLPIVATHPWVSAACRAARTAWA